MTTLTEGAKHPNDVCYCGDYRHQHEDGDGRCRLNGLGHPGGSSCNRFRLTTPFAPRTALAQEGGE